jgi:hypothetical protein
MHSNQSNNSDNRPVYLDIFNAKVEEIDKTDETLLMSFEATSDFCHKIEEVKKTIKLRVLF